MLRRVEHEKSFITSGLDHMPGSVVSDQSTHLAEACQSDYLR